MEQLTKISVEEAMGGKRPHPLIDVLTLHQDHIQQLNTLANPSSRSEAQHDFACKNWGFLIDDVAEIARFHLEPLDIIAVGSKVMDVLPDHLYLRYDFTTLVAGFYAIQGLEKEHKNIPSHFMQTNQLPVNAQNNEGVLFHFETRLRQILRSIQPISRYINKTDHSTALVEVCENMTTGSAVFLTRISLARH